ncbi:UPF0481 protein At3g47200-like [Malania oleifera]|uniref:UPF0481 protein At3g47200-like n=1 Tax=Malania oleifera TaxID=397392 RepID=UPI0025AE7870|nr:UPF0481 protein At3g47200-like [Malania oleifera]
MEEKEYIPDRLTIDVQSLTNSIENSMRMHLASPLSVEHCSIFKVPDILSQHNPKAYVPVAFSIGPLHHGEERLKAAEKIKLHYLHGLISREKIPLNDLVQVVLGLEDEARRSYASPINLSTERFTEILVVDGSFIVELLRKSGNRVQPEAGDPIFGMASMMELLYHDLILLENQVPWRVLELLFSQTRTLSTNPPGSSTLSGLARDFFGKIFSWVRHSTVDDQHSYSTHKHVLDFLRNSLVSNSAHESQRALKSARLIPSAARLVEAGIKLKKADGPSGTSKSILDIQFNKGVLEVPQLMVSEITESLLRNLISFEQCSHGCTTRITSYAILLDSLINDTKDMELLCESKIIDNWLNPEEAANLFNKLYHDTFVHTFFYEELCDRVNKYCDTQWHRWRATYVRNHFSTPWGIASQILAAFFLFISILQAIKTIKTF